MPHLSDLPWHLLFCVADTYYGGAFDHLESDTKKQKCERKPEAVIENELWKHTFVVCAVLQ